MRRGVDTGISPFEPQREGVFPAPPPDSAGNARPSPRWGGPFGPARDRLIPALPWDAPSQNENCRNRGGQLDKTPCIRSGGAVCRSSGATMPLPWWSTAVAHMRRHIHHSAHLARDIGMFGLAGLTSTLWRLGLTTRSMSSRGMAPISGSSPMIIAPVKQRRFLKRISTGPL